MSEKFEDELQYKLEVSLEAVADERHFDELLELAVGTCLKNPLQPGHESRDEPDPIIARLGLWGLRAVMDINQLQELHFEKDEPHLEQLVGEPDLLAPPADGAIQDKIERFGKSLINEAFDSLGPDAPAMVEKFKNASSVYERVQVMDWLMNRMYDIAGKNPLIEEIYEDDDPGEEEFKIETRELSEEEQAEIRARQHDLVEQIKISVHETIRREYADDANEMLNATDSNFYHPVRLSPKVIGQFPDIKVAPTCLGVSILMAAFFEKTGTPYLHTGVMVTPFEEARNYAGAQIDLIYKLAEVKGITLPYFIQTRLDKIRQEVTAATEQHRGYHAGVLTKVGDKEWMELDPNYGHFSFFSEHDNSKLSEIYSNLQALNGVEMSYATNETMLLRSAYWTIAELVDNLVEIAPAADVLQAAIDADVPADILMDYMLSVLAESGAHDILVDDMIRDKPEDGSKEGYVEMLFAYAYGRVFFDDVDVFSDAVDFRAALERCRRDKEYFRRRVEDMTMMPAYVLSRIHSDIINHMAEHQYNLRLPYAALDLGMPYYRIGATVLSDFAVYTQSELSPRFWRRHWPSQIVATEHPLHDDATPYEVIQQNLLIKMLSNTSLRYSGTHGIVKKFLKRQEGTTEDGQADQIQG